MSKLVTWSNEDATKELSKRLNYAKQIRAKFEADWTEAENTLFNTRPSGSSGLNISAEEGLGEVDEVGQGTADYSINYAYKNYRFICSQLAANPPTVIVRPSSSDLSDRRKADAADRASRYSRTRYGLQDIFELGINNNQAYGIAITKTIWDATQGDPIDYNEETGEVVLTGDISIINLSPWNFYIDPDAECWEEVKFVFERVMMPYEEACYRFSDKKDVLKKHRIREGADSAEDKRSLLNKDYYDAVELYQYWEKGLPHNGYIGRMCWCTKDGTLVTEVSPNPFRFAPPKDGGLSLPEADYETKREKLAKAYIPYHVFTDGDVPGHVWGKANILYSTSLQDLHNRLYNSIISAVQAHGVPRLILPEGSDLGEGTITNSPWDIIRVSGTGQQPNFMEPMPLPAAISDLLVLTKQGVDDLAGVNENMFGKQSREQSGFSMQYATSQGNMIRQRVFNKYRLYVESVYKAILNLIRKHWTEERTIHVLGKEKAFEAMDLKGADIEGGYDLVAEYGASLSIDPTARREEIITLMPIFEKAGIDTRTILSLLKLNDLDGAYDRVTMAADRQREIFEEMIKNDLYIKPKELQDHKNMLAFSYDYLMSSEFKYLTPEHQALLERHIKDREALAAQGPQPGVAPAGEVVQTAPAPTPGPGGPTQVPAAPPIQ